MANSKMDDKTDNMTDKQRKIVETYRRCSSLNKTAKLCGCSIGTVTKTLITYDGYETELTKRIGYLAKQGYTVYEIAEIVGKSDRTIYCYLPYQNETTARSVPDGLDAGTGATDRQKSILAFYRKGYSLREISKLSECSHATVVKTLVTYGLYETDSAREVEQLSAQGLDAKEIADILHKSESFVNKYLPYIRGTYLTEDDQKSIPSIRCKRYRERKKQQKET